MLSAANLVKMRDKMRRPVSKENLPEAAPETFCMFLEAKRFGIVAGNLIEFG